MDFAILRRGKEQEDEPNSCLFGRGEESVMIRWTAIDTF